MAILRAAGTASFTLDATSDTLITGLTLTPPNGNYKLFATVENETPSTGGSENNIFSVYVGGTIVSHTERQVMEETSLDGDRTTVALNANVAPNGSQAVEIRHRASGAGTPKLAFRRELTLFPEPVAGTSYEDSDTVDDTRTASAFVTLDGMTRTPVSGKYLLLWTADAETTADDEVAFRVEVGGSALTHTLRQFANENSLPSTPRPVMIACEVNPNGSQVVEIAWSNVPATGTVTCHKRNMMLIPVGTGDIQEAQGTADDARSATGEVLIDDMTITDPGADDWLYCYSSWNDIGTIGNLIATTYSVRAGGTKITDSDRRNDHEGSTDLLPLPVLAGGRITVLDSIDDVEMYWDNSTADTFTQKNRTLVMMRELPDLPIFPYHAYEQSRRYLWQLQND